MTVGNRIRQRRLELGWTQTELAERMGYSGKSTVCMAETCGDNITTTKVQKFADALGVTPRYLMGYEDRRAGDEQAAIALYERYKNAPPDIQSAVETLLKSAQQNP